MMEREGYIERGPIGVEAMQQISQSLSENLGNLLEKVAKREMDIRSKLSWLLHPCFQLS